MTIDEEIEKAKGTRDHEILSGVEAMEMINASIRIGKLLDERRAEIKKAYARLPDPDSIVFDVFYVPYMPKNKFPCLVTEDFCQDTYGEYMFIKRGGRWVMTEEEFNKHLYKGLVL